MCRLTNQRAGRSRWTNQRAGRVDGPIGEQVVLDGPIREQNKKTDQSEFLFEFHHGMTDQSECTHVLADQSESREGMFGFHLTNQRVGIISPCKGIKEESQLSVNRG